MEAKNWLINNQNTDGDWSSTVGDTTAAVNTLIKAGVSTDNQLVSDAHNWMMDKQGIEGGIESNVRLTALTALSFLIQEKTGCHCTKDALAYLIKSPKKNGSWNDNIRQTSLAIRALALADEMGVQVSEESLTPLTSPKKISTPK